MSDPLDQLFRDAQANPPHVVPPPGQWNKIRRGETTLSSYRKSFSSAMLLLGLLIGLGGGVPLGAYFARTVCPEVAENLLIAEAQTISTPPQYLPVAGDTAFSTITAPAPAPQNPVSLKHKSHSVFGSGTKEAPVLLLANDSFINPLTAPETIMANLIVGPDSVSTNEILEMNPEDNERMRSGISITIVGGELPQSVESLLRQPITAKLEDYAARTPINLPNIIFKKLNPVGRWETGVHATPWLSESTTLVSTYSETMNGRTPQTFTFNDNDVVLYPKNNINPNLNQRFQVKWISFEVARQFPIGLRIGAGMVWQPRHVRGLWDEREYLNAQLLSDEWARYRTVVTQELSAFLNVDYTFRRRKRFRPYLGVTLLSNFYQDGNFAQFLFERETGSLEEQYRVYSTVSGNFGNLHILPRTGFQYELTDHLSVGVEVIPGIGVGGRWRW